MTTKADGSDLRYLLQLAVMECVLQGTLIPMLATFLTSRSASKRPTRLKIYVIFINALGLTQTIAAVLRVFDILDAASHRHILVTVHICLTGAICSSVQAFFLYRCWIILGKRILPIAPFLALLAVSLVSGIMSVVCSSATTTPSPARNVRYEIEEPCAGCMHRKFIPFVLDFFMTTTTMIFLYRTRSGLREYDGLFSAIWGVVWASATPPFIFMSVTLINGYIVPGGPFPLAVFSPGINAKMFTLSLMISLLGQSHVRQRLDGSHPSQPPNMDSSLTGVISEPVFAPIMVTAAEGHSLPPSNTRSITTADLSQDSLPSDYGENRLAKSDVLIEKPKEAEGSHATCLVQLPPGEPR
ncbi:unnamed protein product [Rhizoctonia solani]|uniref:Uncharacterized protein n=1 Tax=Rhizoctonia solani TaxID=456999 RepID=A0A8H3E6X1_9AGAM|nr:unnamed protein product [Rhizoctonia solani]